ncbi:gliding motility-associated C-terminal domain-containing protein, partial [Bacteroidota bacterium]
LRWLNFLKRINLLYLVDVKSCLGLKSEVFFMLRSFVLLVLLCGANPLKAQLFVNTNIFLNDVSVSVNNGGLINGVVVAEGGSFKNEGQIHLNGNWENLNPTPLSAFTVDSGLVDFNGAEQYVLGTPTNFHDVDLNGSKTKFLATNAQVSGTLSLNERHLATQSNTLRVTNSSSAAITSTIPDGSISCTPGSGWVEWSMVDDSYFLPLSAGEGIGYRPLTIRPTEAGNHDFKTRLVYKNPSSDGFDIKALGSGEKELCGINPHFYHELSRVSGGGTIDLGLNYFEDSDGLYNTVAHWNASLWEENNASHIKASNALGLNETNLTSASYGDLQFQQYALAGEGCEVYIPNVFSPNGDGNNDLFYVRGKELETLDLIIYDRWGEKVYQSNDFDAPWDGTFRQQPMAPAVFVYKAVVGFIGGGSKVFNGNVTLLR